MTDALYLIVALAFAIWQLGRLGESPGRWGSLTLLVGATAGTMGVAGLPSHFAVFRLQCWGLFLVLPLWCLSAAAVCRSESRVGPPVLAMIGLLLAAAGIDAFWYEPRALERNRHTIWSSKVDTPLRIAIVSDLQTDRPGTYELDALRLALDAQPDILLFPGDYLQVDDREQYEALGFELRELHR